MSRRDRGELQPGIVRLRLVQLAPTLATASDGSFNMFLSGGASRFQVGQRLQVGTGATAEVMTVLAINGQRVSFTGPPFFGHRARSPVFPADSSYGTMLGRTFFATWAGLNGRTAQGRGFTEGNYERRMNEEGSFSITVPNSVGTDGILHRQRFLICATADYRPGDEWIEIWRTDSPSRAGDLLFVGTPTQVPQWDETQITITGYDAMWTLKKSRESVVGFHTAAPRDVFEEYTKSYTVLGAEGFDVPSSFPTSTTVSTVSYDNQWDYIGGGASPVPSFLRLASQYQGGAGTTSFIRGRRGDQVTIPSLLDPATGRWRIETSVVAPVFNVGDSLTLSLNDSLSSTDACSIRLTAANSSYTTVLSATATTPLQYANTGGTVALAIEGYGRWIYFFLNGQLVSVLPAPSTSSATWEPKLTFVHVGTPQPNYYVDVDYIVSRMALPYLMSPSAPGDYRLPGVPVSGGLQGSYFNDADLATGTDMGGKQLSPLRAGTTGGPGLYGKRLDKTLTFADATWPTVAGSSPTPDTSGLPANFSVRWVGSIYLDAAYDYKLVVNCSGWARVWLGKTRFRDATLLGAWLNSNITGNSNVQTLMSSAVFGTAGSPGPLYGMPSGWYPIIVEKQGGAGDAPLVPTMRLGYMRSDMSNWPGSRIINTVPVNGSPYPHTVMADSPVHYWSLADPTTGSLDFVDSIAGGVLNSQSLTPAAGITYGQVSAIPGEKAATFSGGATAYFNDATNANLAGGTTGFAGVTVEAWIYQTSSTGVQEIFRKNQNIAFRTNAGVLEAIFGNGTAFASSVTGGPSISLNTWHHVAVTYNPTTGVVVFYVDGAATTLSTSTGQVGNNVGTGTQQNALQIGRDWSGAEFFVGSIAHVALYSTVLSAARIAAHVAAPNSQVQVGGTTSGFLAQSALPASPQGVFDALVRNDSHYEQVRALLDAFAIQTRLEPRSLESGQFPGQLVPRVRVGTDTDFVLDKTAAYEARTAINAEDSADSLVVDAQGLADPTNSGQLYMEAFQLAEMTAHGISSAEYDSPGDIQNAQQLQQRATSLLSLRTNSWQVIEGHPQGRRELVDSFPLTGALREFAWEPGDGIRFRLPSLGVEDFSPRQILGVQWPFFPDGLAVPLARYRQRPRSFKETLRKMARDSRNESRNYQGQFITMLGTAGSNNGTGVNNGSTPDTVARLALPNDLSTVVRLTFCATFVDTTITTPHTIFVNGVSTGITFIRAGRYDVTAYLLRDPSANGQTGRMYASAANGNKAAEYQLEALVKV